MLIYFIIKIFVVYQVKLAVCSQLIKVRMNPTWFGRGHRGFCTSLLLDLDNIQMMDLSWIIRFVILIAKRALKKQIVLISFFEGPLLGLNTNLLLNLLDDHLLWNFFFDAEGAHFVFERIFWNSTQRTIIVE